MLIDLEPGDPRWEDALPVLQELRPHLTSRLLDQVLEEGGAQGLRFTALIEATELSRACLGRAMGSRETAGG
jgi:hypothetical protein